MYTVSPISLAEPFGIVAFFGLVSKLVSVLIKLNCLRVEVREADAVISCLIAELGMLEYILQRHTFFTYKPARPMYPGNIATIASHR